MHYGNGDLDTAAVMQSVYCGFKSPRSFRQLLPILRQINTLEVRRQATHLRDSQKALRALESLLRFGIRILCPSGLLSSNNWRTGWIALQGLLPGRLLFLPDRVESGQEMGAIHPNGDWGSPKHPSAQVPYSYWSLG